MMRLLESMASCEVPQLPAVTFCCNRLPQMSYTHSSPVHVPVLDMVFSRFSSS